MTDVDGICLSNRKKNFDERLLTFKNWTGKVNPVELAKAGFYFTRHMDACRCVFCDLEIYHWETDDCPLKEHLKFNRCCTFANVLNLSKIYYEKGNELPVNVKCNVSKILCYVMLFIVVLHIMKCYVFL